MAVSAGDEDVDDEEGTEDFITWWSWEGMCTTGDKGTSWAEEGLEPGEVDWLYGVCFCVSIVLSDVVMPATR